MEIDVVDALADIGYDGPLTDSAVFQEALEGGPKSPMYTGLVHYLSEELRLLCKLEESVNRTNRPDESSHFLLEVSSFLKELGCPYVSLVSGHMSSRLQCTCDRVLLLDYLLAELMAARMLAVDKPEDDSSTMEVTIDETSTAKDLKDILDALKMTQPPANISPALLFQKLKEKLKIVLQKEGPDFTGRPLYNQSLTEKQWKEMEELHKQKLDEFRLRREMLITRLDCTIQSFEWKGKESVRNEDIQRVYKPLRQRMLVQPEVKLSDFLAARSSMLAVKKTSDAAVRINTKSDINNYIIGRVPDRGGRPSEQQAPPPEMPSWQQDRSQGGGRGRGGGGRGSDRGGGRGASGFGGQGGRVQGGWSQPSGDQRYSAGANRGGGNQGFQQDNQGGNNRGGYNGNRGGRGGYNEGVVAADAYDDRNRGGSGFNDRNRGSGGGGYNDRNRSSGGYSDGNRGGYSDGNRGGYNDGNRSGYNDGNRGGYNEGSRSGFQGPKPVHHQRQSQSLGFHNQNRIPTYEEENQGYQSHSQGRYQNEHDDRTSSSYRGSMRGRSSYNRGGRN